MKKNSAFTLKSGNKPSMAKVAGISPMKIESEPAAENQQDGMKYKTMDFRTWKNEVWNKYNSYGEGLEIPDAYAKPDYEEYLALENERAEETK